MKNLKVKRSEVEKNGHARGLTHILWIDHAGQAGGNDFHDTDELFRALTGELELEVESRRFQQKILEEILIPAHPPHTVTEHRE